jgi:hypothetical protein
MEIRTGITGPHRKVSGVARMLRRIRRCFEGRPTVDVPERMRMIIAIDRSEITDPLYESKQKALYGPDWRPAA